MEQADLTFYEACAGLVYFLATIALLLVGMMQGNRNDKSAEHILSFRRPVALKIAGGMFILLLLAPDFAFNPITFGFWEFWLFFVPTSLLLTVPCILMIGPHDVSIDLQTKTCQVTNGWVFRPRTRRYSLTAASSVCVCSGGEAYYVFLVIGDGTHTRLMLEPVSGKNDAITYAQEIGDRLQLPVKNIPLRQLRSLN